MDESNEVFVVIARRLKALADPTRLAIIHALCESEKNVSTIIEITGFSQARISKHLRILREEKFIAPRREQRRVNYRLTSNLPRRICELACESIECGMNEDLEKIKKFAWTRERRAER